MRKFAANTIETAFVAPAVRRDIFVLDDSTIGRGYVIAQTRTFNTTCTPVEEDDRPCYGDAEIVRIETAWHYDPIKPSTIPIVSIRDLQDWIQNDFPDATFGAERLNDGCDSWRLRVTNAQNVIEFTWTPLKGFHGKDCSLAGTGPTYDTCEECLNSIVDAAVFAMDKFRPATHNDG